MKGEIPRPPNAWILYRSDKNAEITAEYAENGKKITQCEVSTTVAQMWRAATPEERAHYEILAEQAKERHAAMYPGYKFQPKKPEQKAKEKAEKALRKATPKLSRARARAQAQPYTSARGPEVASPVSQFAKADEVTLNLPNTVGAFPLPSFDTLTYDVNVPPRVNQGASVNYENMQFYDQPGIGPVAGPSYSYYETELPPHSGMYYPGTDTW